MNAQKVSINRIIGNVVGNLRLKNVSSVIDDFARWAVEAENKIGSTNSYVHRECELTIKNKRACLPPDFVYLEGLKIGNKYLNVSFKQFRIFGNSTKSSNLSDTTASNINTGPMALSRLDGNGFNVDLGINASVFSITNGWVNFNTDDNTKIGISYMGLDLDEDGWPLIAKKHEDAVTHYLMYMYKAGEYYEGKLAQHVFVELKERWFWLCGQARGDDEMPDEEGLKYLSNMWNQKLPLANKNFF